MADYKMRRMPDDPFQGKEWDEFVRHVIDGPESLPQMIYTSAVSVALVPEEVTATDVKFAIELGFMIMFDKPIIAVVRPGTHVPDKLRRVAEHIVEDDGNDNDKLARTLKKILQDMEDEDGQ